MARFPRFTQGIGRLTARVLNDAISLIEEIPGIIDRLQRLERPRPRVKPRTSFWAFIVGYSNIGLNRWEYAWVAAIPDPSNAGKFKVLSHPDYISGETLYESSYTTYEPGLEDSGSPFTTPAYNAIEQGNDGLANESAGVYVEGPAWPDNWFLQPIHGGDSGGQGGQDPSEFDPGTDNYWPTSKAPVVQIHLIEDEDGDLTYWFQVANDSDGECDPR